MSAAATPAVRGEMIDVGGRSLRAVRAGPAGAKPLVVLEHGAFGCAADWAVVQERLAAKGLASVAYDRAGLGYSEPGPKPRDGAAAAADLEALLKGLGEAGPIVLVGHSMGGLTTRVFTLRHPEMVLGLVLVDAMTPDVIDLPAARHAIGSFGLLLKAAAAVGRFGLMRPVSWISHNLIGLTGEAKVEKRRIHGSGSHAVWSSEEVAHWPHTSQLAAGELSPDLPVAVVTAGGERNKPWLKTLQAAPAAVSRHGYVEHVAGSTHANLLGVRFADPIVRGVEHVLKAAA